MIQTNQALGNGTSSPGSLYIELNWWVPNNILLNELQYYQGPNEGQIHAFPFLVNIFFKK